MRRRPTDIALALAATAGALVVLAAPLLAYDVYVRRPATPRFGVVDIARLYAAAERQAKQRVLARGRDDGTAESALPEAGRRIAIEVATLGTDIEAALRALSQSCRCTIVAMAAVFGSSPAIVDLTQAAAERMGLGLLPHGAPGADAAPPERSPAASATRTAPWPSR